MSVVARARTNETAQMLWIASLQAKVDVAKEDTMAGRIGTRHISLSLKLYLT